MDETTTDLEASFKFARIDITSPWLNSLLFNINGWKLGKAYKKSGLSNGTKNQQLNTLFILLSTSLIAVNDLKITANWGPL